MVRWWLLLGVSLASIALWGATLADREGHNPGDAHVLPFVFSFGPAEVVGLSIGRNEAAIEFLRDPRSQWVDASGESVRGVEETLATFLRARVERRLPLESMDEEGFGFGAPSMSLRLERVLDEPDISLRFGGLAPDQLSRFVWVEGAPEIITIPDYHFRALVALTSQSGMQP